MKLLHLRHASHILTYGNKRLLVDPVLAEQGTYDPIPSNYSKAKNPLVPLPLSLDFLNTIDGILITHLHNDHFDEVARQILDKKLSVYCQPCDAAKIKLLGFENVFPIDDHMTLNDQMTIYRVGGRHGHGATALAMGNVSGYILKAPNEVTLYIVGDSVWCRCVKSAITLHQPTHLIVYAGSAKLPIGKPITMGVKDIESLWMYRPELRIIAIHMESWNHCELSRAQLKEHFNNTPFSKQLTIPTDGGLVEIN